VQEAVKAIEQVRVDHAERILFDQVKAGDGQAVRFYLGTIGRDRGYTRRYQITTPQGMPLEVKQQSSGIDWSRLTNEELSIIHALINRAKGREDSEDDALVALGRLPPLDESRLIKSPNVEATVRSPARLP